MKSEYSIVIEIKERSHFKDVLTRTNAKWQVLGGDSREITYVVSLSKYELLYLRLACKVGKIKAINETTEVI